ncbi:hypothetical protein SSTU70S_02706 [Stutzerimonas stutzeri]
MPDRPAPVPSGNESASRINSDAIFPARPAPLTLPCVLAGSALLTLCATAHADNRADSALSLGTTTVTADSSGPLQTSSVISSVDLLGGDILEQQPVLYSWELFRRAPGVMLTEFGQGTTSGKLSFRGFNGEGEVNAVKLLIDGIPSNSNNGNMPYLDMLFPLEIDGIEVVRGTNDPRYGLYNIAGNVTVYCAPAAITARRGCATAATTPRNCKWPRASRAATGRRTTPSASRRAAAIAITPMPSAPACPASGSTSRTPVPGAWA